MDSFKDVLEAAQAYCKTQMAEPTYNLYIDGLEPISFEDSSHITLSVRNDFICKIVTDRYLGLLKEAFKTVLGFDVDIIRAIGRTKSCWPSSTRRTPPPRRATTNSPSKTSSRARPTSLRLLRRRRWRPTPPEPTTRCSSTAAPVWARPIC